MKIIYALTEILKYLHTLCEKNIHAYHKITTTPVDTKLYKLWWASFHFDMTRILTFCRSNATQV